MSTLECPRVEEVSIEIPDFEGEPTEIWPGDMPLPSLDTIEKWDEFVSRYDLSEVFEEKLLTTSKKGFIVINAPERESP